MTDCTGGPGLPDDTKAPQETPAEDGKAAPKNDLPAQVKKLIPVVFGLSGDDPRALKERLPDLVKKLIKNPGQVSGDFLDSLFGTGADGISREDDTERTGKIDFAMDLPDPVRMPAAYSVVYHRHDDKKKEVVTTLERDGDGNIRYLDDGKECVFVRTDGGFCRVPVLPGRKGFGRWDGVLLSARSVRRLTDHFWNCADQTFIKWLGMELTEKTEYLGRQCGLYHAQPGTLTFTYHCDMVIDDETGICLCYTANELLKSAVFSKTSDGRISVGIGDRSIGGAEMDFCCTKFDTENISFDVPAV
ncbi:MAG: hypothetical protein IKP22_07760 [Clostridia bacterium]|nr:hypothetical protein [Clostridia bacterium]